MPYYADLNLDAPQAGLDWRADPEGRARTIERLSALRAALDDTARGGPPRRTLASLLLATWNLREFDSAVGGERLPETYAYIAEIIDRFDLVAVQEVRDDLRALERLRDRLGHHWCYLVSDVTEGRAGNRERLAFLYDTDKVHFLGMAGELVLPPVIVGGKTVPVAQIARTPLMAAFQVGWTKFVLTTVHVIYGEGSAEPPQRVEEISQIARFLRRRTELATEPIRNFIVLGDFNIFSSDDATMRALVDEGGFTVPDAIRAIPGSNVPKDRKYDQIAYRAHPDRFEATGRAGVFDYFEVVFRKEDEAVYRRYIDAGDQRSDSGAGSVAGSGAGSVAGSAPPPDGGGREGGYLTWRTYQMSDHLPLWAEFRVDFADQYLSRLAAQLADQADRAGVDSTPLATNRPASSARTAPVQMPSPARDR